MNACWALVVAAALLAPTVAGAVPHGGVALSLCHEASVTPNYAGMLWEIARLGATQVSLVVSWGQADVAATELAPRPETPPDEIVRRTIRQAHALGLSVTLFPIVSIDTRAPGEWRGVLRPTEPAAWFAAHRRFIMHYAELAADEGAERLSVGSEFGSLEAYESAWLQLIRAVRDRYDGELTYSANWDHYFDTPFWHALDLAAVTAYYELAEDGEPVARSDLDARIEEFWRALESFAVGRGVRVMVSEAGYVSQPTAAARPWDHTARGPVDLALQDLCWDAFLAAAWDQDFLESVMVWNWFGPGGPADTDYTPRNKPAALTIARWFGIGQDAGP